MTLLAKNDEEAKVDLKTHGEDAKNYAEKILANIKKPIGMENFIEYKDLESVISMMSLLHDIGKSDRRVQQYLWKQKKESPPHPLLSLPIVAPVLDKYSIDELIKNLSILTVASHHTPLHPDLYNNYTKLKTEYDNELEILLNDWKLDLNLKSIETTPYKIFYNAKRKLIERINENGLIIRKLFTFIQGVIMKADYCASARYGVYNINYPTSFKPVLRWHQRSVLNVKGNIFINLPTGTGKTETALYWAKNIKAKNLFYVLPTMATINAMHERLKGYFKDAVGIYHSSLEYFLSVDDFMKNSTIYKYFLTPINVTTPDQLILTLMNYKKYSIREISFSNAAFIFDEIHAYDTYTFYLIKGLIEYLYREYNPHFCIMSATFPKFFKDELEFLGASEIPPLNVESFVFTPEIEYKRRKRTKPVYHAGYKLKDSIEDIEREYRFGNKVLVICNTVKKSQEIYTELKNRGKIRIQDMLLFHGKFILSERAKKEQILEVQKKEGKKPFVLLATQVVEVSLDIDYDVLFTEIAPLDSLIQRFGRINRNREENILNPSIVNIYDCDSPLPYDPDFIEYSKEIVEDLFKEFTTSSVTEFNYVIATNNFYEKIKNKISEQESFKHRYDEIWRHLSYIFSVRLSDRNVRQLLRTRSGFISIPVIPIKFKDDVKKLEEKIEKAPEKERISLIREKMGFYVDVPISAIPKNFVGDRGDFLKVNYDDELGLIMNSL